MLYRFLLDEYLRERTLESQFLTMDALTAPSAVHTMKLWLVIVAKIVYIHVAGYRYSSSFRTAHV